MRQGVVERLRANHAEHLLGVHMVNVPRPSIGSSQPLYREAFADVGDVAAGAPVAVAIFPGGILPAPRAWAERWFDLTRWTHMPRGGHFRASKRVPARTLTW